jgi:hypothetical protein
MMENVMWCRKRDGFKPLEKWILKVTEKKNAHQRSGMEDLRLQVMLSNTLRNAKTELKVKQHHQLQRMKAEGRKTGFDVCKDTSKPVPHFLSSSVLFSVWCLLLFIFCYFIILYYAS